MSELGKSDLDQWGRRRVALRCMQIRQFSQGPRELNRCENIFLLFLVFLSKGECFILKVDHYTSRAVDVLKKEIVATTAFKRKYPIFGLACFHCRSKFSLGLNVNVTKSFK